jgi:alkylhydroperoxidase family enzyme
MVGLRAEQILESREGKGDSERATAALTFAKHLLDTRGQVSEADLSALRAAGFSDGESAEIIAHVALNVFTNYFNIAAEVDIDFPKVTYTKIA